MIQRDARKLVVIMAVALLAGCSYLTSTTGQTGAQDIADLQASLITAYDTTAQLLVGGIITKAQAIVVRNSLQQAETAIRSAQAALANGDPNTAQQYITTASNIVGPILKALGAPGTLPTPAPTSARWVDPEYYPSVGA